MGFARLYETGPASDAILLLATGASVNLVLEPIYSSAIWGAGWYNAATSAHYGDGPLRYEGNIDIELQGTNELWNLVRDWASEQRAYPRSADICPDGQNVYQFRTTGAYDATFDNEGAWCTSAGFSTSEGSFVTVSLGVVGLSRTIGTPAGAATYINQRTGVIAGTSPDTIRGSYPLNPVSSNVSPIPYWRTNANLLDLDSGGALVYPNYPSYTPFSSGSAIQAGLETVEWSIDCTNNHVVLYTCDGDRQATAVLQGAQDASGSVTLYRSEGVFDPITGPSGTGTETNPWSYAQRLCFRVEIERSPASSNAVYIELPAAQIESDDYSLRGQSDVVTRGFSIKGLGGRPDATTATVIYPCFLMSEAT